MFLKKLIGDKEFYKRVLVITLPVVIQNVISNFVNLIDNVMVGQVGTEQMSGVAIVNELMWVFNICIFGGIAGAGIFTAQFFGKSDTKGVRDTFRIKMIVITVITAISVALCIFARDPLISLFLHEGEQGLDIAATLEYGRQYIAVMIFQMLPFAIMQAYASTLRETGETMLPMLSGIAAVFINIFLNYILIFGKFGFPQLGIVGAAIATVIARFAECLIVIVWTHAKKCENPFIIGAYRSFAIPKALALSVAKKGFPLLINEILWSVGMATLMQCYSVRGLEVVSAFNISSTVSNLFFCGFFALGTTISIIIGQHLGAGNLEKAREEDRKLLFLIVIVCSVIGIAMAICAPFIPEMYNTTEGVKALACRFLTVSALLVPFSGFAYACYFTMRSGGNTIVTFLFDSVFMWSVCIPLAFILSRFTAIPILHLYAVIQGIDIIKASIGFVLVKRGKWVNNLVGKVSADTI